MSDKLTQNEIEDLEGTLNQSRNSDTSILRDLLDKIPDGLFGSEDKKSKLDEIQNNANAAQMESMSVSPREPEEFTRYVQQVFQQVMPAIQFHDDLLKDISQAISKIPVLPKIIEQLEEQMSIFVFSVIAPFVVPLIDQIKNELATGSNEIIQSSKNEQHIVFDDDNSTDPTHSMLSKDHFTNVRQRSRFILLKKKRANKNQILNEIAGRTASKVVSWVVPQLMEAWDDDNCDVDRMLNKIIYGVLHHPAQRDMGPDGAREGRALIYDSVREWWGDMDDGQRDEYRRKLSRDGVYRGENHKEGQHDCGHGCGGKLKMHKNFKNGEPETLEDRIAGAAADAIIGGVKQSFQAAAQDSGLGGDFGGGGGGGEQREEGGLGGFLSSVAGGILGGAFKRDETESYRTSGRTEDGGYTETTTEYGRSGDRYGQAQYTETQYGDNSGGRSEYRRYEQDQSGGGESQSYYSEQRTETRYGGGGGGYGQEEGEYGRREESGYGRRDEDSYGGGYGRRQEEEESGGYSAGYGRREEESYGGGGGYGRRNDDEEGYGGGYRRREEEEESYGRRDEDSYGGGYYGRREVSHGGGRNVDYGRRTKKDHDSDSDDDDDKRKDKKHGHKKKDGHGSDDDKHRRKRSGSHGRRRSGSHGRRGKESDDEDSGREKKKYGHRKKGSRGSEDSDDDRKKKYDKGRERRGWGY